MIARILCRLFGHRWEEDIEWWGRKRFAVCWCRRCGHWGATVSSPVAFAVGRDDVINAWRVDGTYGQAEAIEHCRNRAA